MKSFGTRFLCGLVAFLLVPSLAMAQQGQITGTVVDASSEEALPGASVLILDSEVGTSADVEGEYTITGVEPGEKTLRVSFVGYSTVERTVTLDPGGTVTADFQLEPTAKNLDEVVVTGVSSETPQAKLSFNVGQVGSGELEEAPASSPMGSLQGKLAGTSIVQNSGAPGDNFSVRLRGTTSLSGSNQPLVIIDGVITSAGQVDFGSLNVDNIEVVKGAAASSLYGSRASNGVVNITTKRGQGAELGETRVTVRSEFGVQSLEETPPTNRATGFATNDQGQLINADGDPVNFESGSQALAGNFPVGSSPSAGPNGTTFYRTPISELQRADGSSYETNRPFDQFFNPGNNTTNFIAVSRNNQDTNFRLSFTDTREEGPIQGEVSTEGYKRQNFRLNIDHRANEDVQVSGSAMYATSTNDDPQAADINPFFGIMFTNPLSDLTERGEDGELDFQADASAIEENPLYVIENSELEQERSRFLGNIRAEYSPVEWVTLEGNLSYDRSDQDDSEFYDKGFETIDASARNNGETQQSNQIDEALNADVTLSLQGESGEWTGRSQFKWQIEDSHFESVFVQGNGFAAQGIPDFGNIRGNKTINSFTRDIKSESFYATGSGDYGDRYILDFLVRRDGSSLFGEEERWQTYFRAAGAYRLSEEPFWPFQESLSEAKVRYSYGTAGGRPVFAAQYETFSVSNGSLSKNTLGNDQLKPELQVEQEFGLELGFYDKVFLDVTYADTQVEDQLLRVPLPGVVGFSQRWENAGTLESQTLEVSLDADVLRTSNISWNVGATFDRTRQEITEFGANPFRTGPENRFLYREGSKLGGIFGNKWIEKESELTEMGFDPAKFDKNDDGYYVPVGEGNSWRDGWNGDADCPSDEGCWGTSVPTADGPKDWGLPIKFEDSDRNKIFKIGNTVPDFNLNFNTNFRYKGFSLYALVSHQNGGDVYNFTRQWSYRDRRHKDIDDRNVSQEKAKSDSYYAQVYDATGTNQHFVEDATFVKLREVSLGYTFDESQLNNLIGPSNFVNEVSLRLTGRNLVTWTDYSGIDPEVGSTAGGPGGNSDASLFRVDNFSYPKFRTITGSLEVQF